MEDEKPLKHLLNQMFHTYKMGDKYDEIKVVNSWEQIAGKMIAQKTSKLYIKNRIMYLHVSSAALKNELNYHKLVLIEKVNTFAKNQIINDIQIF